MGCKYRCIVILLAFNAIFAIVSLIFWGTNGVINFEAAFFSFFFVLYSAYTSLKHKIKKEIDQADLPQEEESEETQNTKNPKTKFNFSSFVLGLQLSMGFLRIFAYFVLIGGLVILMTKNIFLVIPYILGISICLIGVVTLKYLSQKK
ncbi:hypothetical protein BKH41_05035 [Helicobacter sp. 12S02232-10]|nr:hypothetical protein BKH41_05035 [Helicobacter sp. 12S02232-10]